ncbi:MAG: CoA transferase [Dehalococcoidia bacterium]|nr:CoA transferase [Dehalococcoidia bacterium]
MGPMEGIRVLDLSKYGPSRYCSMILGDLGAEVIAVEMPKGAGQTLDVVSDDTGSLYIGHNRSKRAIALNLKKEAGKEILYRLVEKVDVIIENNRPGILKRRGMDYETLSKRNPQLVYCSITGYGQDGPYAQRTGHEINFAAVAGIMALTGSKNGPPVYLQSPSIADLLGGVTQAVIAIVAALYARDRIGKGQYIDVSITDGAIFYHWIDGQQYLLAGGLPQRAESPTGSDIACMNVYKAKDGKYLTVGCAEPWLWADLCRLLGREDFISIQYDLTEKQKEMYDAFSEVFATKDRDEWVRLLEEIDVGVGPVYDFEEMFSDPHFRHRKITAEVEHPRLGKIRVLNTPFKFSETPAEVRSSPPLWGEHTREVLSDLLGYADDEIDRLLQEGVIE